MVKGLLWTLSLTLCDFKMFLKPILTITPSGNLATAPPTTTMECGPCPCPPQCRPLPPGEISAAQALFKVPRGFQALLKHITVELINAKPKDPYDYVSAYLNTKMHDRRKGLLETDFFEDDTLNIDIKPPMHYLNQTSLHDVDCPSTTAFDVMAVEATDTLNASNRGIQDREEVGEIRRDSERKSFRASLSGKRHSTKGSLNSSRNLSGSSGGGPPRNCSAGSSCRR